MNQRLRSARRRFYRALAEDREVQRAVAARLNSLTPEQIAEAMEQLPTTVLEWAVRFESLSRTAPLSEDMLRRGYK